MAQPAPPTIRTLTPQPSDLAQLVRVHRAAFPQSAITRLGAEAVRRYYLWQFEGPHEMTAYGAFVGPDLRGFCFAGCFRGALSGFLAHNRTFLAGQVLTHPWLVLNPLVREKIGFAVRRLIAQPPSPPASAPAPYFSILAIAVHPHAQRQGIGQLLLGAAEALAQQKQYPAVQLSVLTDNHNAIRFYEQNGYQRVTNPTEAWDGRMAKPLLYANIK